MVRAPQRYGVQRFTFPYLTREKHAYSRKLGSIGERNSKNTHCFIPEKARVRVLLHLSSLFS
jgi:hypothetical protein